MDFVQIIIVKGFVALTVMAFFYLWNRFVVKTFAKIFVAVYQKINGHTRDKSYDELVYKFYSTVFWIIAFIVVIVIFKSDL